MFLMSRAKSEMIRPDAALPGRDQALPIEKMHFVLNAPIKDAPEGHAVSIFGMGCFWGVERIFWQLEGVFSTAAGYAAGSTPNPTYQEVCSGRTGHNEVVLVVFDPAQVSVEQLLKAFWEGHNPTQGMRQGNDMGTQYRSGIYVSDDIQAALAAASKESFQRALDAAGYGPITTEIQSTPQFYYAEDYHQQYLAKNVNGYCGLGGTGVTCPAGLPMT